MRQRPGITVFQVAATALVSLASIRLAGGGQAVVAMQAGAFLLAAALALAAARTAFIWRLDPRWLVGAILALAAAVLFLGVGIEGARRWVRVGPVLIHPASLCGSILLMALARAGEDWRSRVLAGAAILVFGLGFDGAASLAFALGVAGLALADAAARRQLLPLCILAWGLAIWSLARVDTLPALPYVEDIVGRTFAVSPALGMAGAAALAMLPLPFLLAARVPGLRGGGLAVAGFWLGLVAASAIGNYPAPVLGYGASPVLGWIIALGCMQPRTVQSAS